MDAKGEYMPQKTLTSWTVPDGEKAGAKQTPSMFPGVHIGSWTAQWKEVGILVKPDSDDTAILQGVWMRAVFAVIEYSGKPGFLAVSHLRV